MTCTHKLIRHNGPHPPGNFPYECPKTGRKFAGEAGIRETALAVTQYHLANPTVFNAQEMDFDYVLSLVDCWTCFRLGNPPQYCTDGKSGSITPAIRIVSSTCQDCNVTMTPKYCPTCSSQRLIAYRCPKCGKEFSV